MLRFLFADLLLEHGLQQTECERCLGRCTGFGDIDDTELLVCEELHELCQVVLTDVVTCIHYIRVLAIFCYEGIKSRSQSLIHSACTKVRTSDTDYYKYITVISYFFRGLLYTFEF